MASGWKLWVWLQCIGVVSGCCCKEVHVYTVGIKKKFLHSIRITGARLKKKNGRRTGNERQRNGR